MRRFHCLIEVLVDPATDIAVKLSASIGSFVRASDLAMTLNMQSSRRGLSGRFSELLKQIHAKAVLSIDLRRV